MVALLALLAGLVAGPLSGLDSKEKFLQITIPKKILSNTSDDAKLQHVSYVITVGETPYTIHLQQKIFLPENFVIYMYNQEGALHSGSSHIETHCHYQGYIDGFPNSLATINTCSGLRGILQFENVSYGIEPLGSAAGFEHLIYQVNNENTDLGLLAENNSAIVSNVLTYKGLLSVESQPDFSPLFPRYLEMHIVVDKALYDYMGSDTLTVTNKVIQIIGLVNTMFTPFNITVVLSSLEFWTDKNKISTTGEADELLQRFLTWKHDYLVLRPHDVAYLLIYQDHPHYVGATFPGKMCIANYAAGIALYSRSITLETFSVIIAQLLGLSMGIAYDDTRNCHCSGTICIMDPEAVRSNGVKTFSSCSFGDFENFISKTGVECLQNQPHLNPLYRSSVCGNKIVEQDEQCDCGNPIECKDNNCCDPSNCKLKPEAQCAHGLCCKNCKIADQGTECRPTAHSECDVTEFCNGSSQYCQPDIHLLNGKLCQENFMCFEGECRSLDSRCQAIFGKGSKNAPFSCYEEINAHQDRFGHCGDFQTKRARYKACSWRNLQCGKLICTYPSRKPFFQENGAVIYVFVRKTVCITIDYRLPFTVMDPMLVKNGSDCDVGRVCINASCVESRFLLQEAKDCAAKCNGHGVCNSKKNCHCSPGWAPPDCRNQGQGRGGSIDNMLFWKYGKVNVHTSEDIRKNKILIGFYIGLPLLIVIIIGFIKWNDLRNWCSHEESVHDDGRSEESDVSYSSNSERSS
ncbi:disintegrin and metalloproteinase domain-containing protein 32 isoform X1 [Ornithorhynchus anatinus]|uniref:ADAM metallopeptidase domain 32 n=1 Tax=Ornithorhynchus anatinus TaxID=9258 RepID=F6PGI1_ORNAN|nr:disintegrin and metalloproteinase domain-containing protein 32 isoform X1 [Ornithorhynchus anatinus]